MSTNILPMAIAGAALLTLTTTGTAQAVTFFTNRTAWESAVGRFTTETFDAPVANAPVITFANGVTSTGSGGSILNEIGGGTYLGRVDTSGNFPDHFREIRWVFPKPVFGFAADWIDTTTGSGLTVSGNFDGSGVQTISFRDRLGDPGTGFLGIVGIASFSELVFREEVAVFGDIGDEFFQVDNLSTTVVPTPALLPGLIGLGLGIWRKRKPEAMTD
ncbi:PTPA-CTERM sorting domain-containing protein [Leptothermofonsia sp. ETS-13]|uniref:PTPA-CTERM sorting domain-containing protein n=1 Tax=Leptothermofonsia sp. ETS-13 TaxID=3035696 RepID=UPI003B9F6A74